MRKKLIKFTAFFLSLPLLFVMAFPVVTSAAERVFVPELISGLHPKEMSAASVNINSVLGLEADNDIRLMREFVDQGGSKTSRYLQTYKGVPVWGYHIIVNQDARGTLKNIYGNKWSGIAADVGSVATRSSFTVSDALLMMKELHIKHSGLSKKQWLFENETSDLSIWFDENNTAHLVYVVSFFSDQVKEANPSRWVFIVDAIDKRLLIKFDALAYANGTGPGGNQKIGKYQYGVDYPAFEVTQNNTVCSMINSYIKTINMNHGTTETAAFEYPCFENTSKEINGAYSPLNDAHYFVTEVYGMYKDWYNTAVVNFQLPVRVHYGSNYENAFWNGTSITFGDGLSSFYPLTSLDVSSHEVSHGFTAQHSDLVYLNQSGGINEAFSDMAGEAAKLYVRGSNDWLLGYDIVKAPGQALRYMDDPTKDGRSIKHVRNYHRLMSVHYSSGIFNKAFYELAVTQGFGVRKAFDVFVKANQSYWGPGTNFQQGGEGCKAAAKDLGYSQTAVRNAFAVVGVEISVPQGIFADFTFAGTDGIENTVKFKDNSTGEPIPVKSWAWGFGDGNTSTLQNPTHKYATAGVYQVTLTVTDEAGKSNSLTKSVSVPVALVYCESTGRIVRDEWVAQIDVAGFSNASGASASGYADYSAMTVDVIKGQATPVILTPGFSDTAVFDYDEYWTIRVDQNRNDIFEKSEEAFTGAGKSIVSGQMTIPASSVSGKTRMRVSMRYSEPAGPCENFLYGEVEDYTINIIDAGLIPSATDRATAH